MSSEWESEEETNAEVYTLGTRDLFLACGLVYNAQPFCVSLFRRSWLKNSLQSSSSFRRYWRSQTQAARIRRKRESDWVTGEERAFLRCLPLAIRIKRILTGSLWLYSWWKHCLYIIHGENMAQLIVFWQFQGNSYSCCCFFLVLRHICQAKASYIPRKRRTVERKNETKLNASWHYGNRLTKLAFLRARAIPREKERGPITLSFDLLIWI